MIATTSQSISTDANPQNWTLLNEHSMLGVGDFWTAEEQAAWGDPEFLPRGSGYDTVTGELYSVANTLYYGDDHTNWIARRTAISGGTRDTGFQSDLTNQGFPSASFANSISNIPQADADAYFGGKRLLVGGGMLSSGAGNDSYGPAAFFMNNNGVGGTTILKYQNHGSAGADVQSSAYAKMDQAVDGPDDYWIDGIGWYYGPPNQHPPGQPVYKLVGEMHDGPAWIDHPNFRGVCWVMQRSIGECSYAVQTEGGSTDWRGILYIYDPLELSEVFHGTKLPYEPTPNFYEIPSNINGFAVGNSRGCAFNAAPGLFYILHPWGWDIGYGTEKYPVIAVYQLAS
jgi:hypothetical protein